MNKLNVNEMLWLKDKHIKVKNKKIRKMFAKKTPLKKKKAIALLILSKSRPKEKSVIRNTESHHVRLKHSIVRKNRAI